MSAGSGLSAAQVADRKAPASDADDFRGTVTGMDPVADKGGLTERLEGGAGEGDISQPALELCAVRKDDAGLPGRGESGRGAFFTKPRHVLVDQPGQAVGQLFALQLRGLEAHGKAVRGYADDLRRDTAQLAEIADDLLAGTGRCG